MRLLNVRTFQFRSFASKPPPYAILSHRWADTEASFSDIEQGRVSTATTHAKVVQFATYVSTNFPSIDWIWVDTCCIKQENSAELSEAVNRMFHWYREATICIAYLYDVDHVADQLALRQSEWFDRGWTLQELLASTVVIFVTKEWQIIGHKGNAEHLSAFTELGRHLEDMLSERTKIPKAVLQEFAASLHLSVEERMSWMDNRKTLREEDRYYAQFGIFGVTIGANYGETAEGARERLRKAIRKKRSRADTLLHDRPDAASAAPATIIPPTDNYYVERPTLLTQIQAHTSASASRLALVGIGGVGKTQLAIRYARKLRESEPDIWLLWIFANNAARFYESVQDLAKQLRLPGLQDPGTDVLQLLYDWLIDSERRWLVILDNVDDAEFILKSSTESAKRTSKRRIDYLPLCDHGRMLITSRNKATALELVDEDQIVQVSPFDAERARQLLQTRLGEMYEEETGLKLAEALDFMPLAITQAAAFIKQKRRRYTMSKYLTELERNRRDKRSLLRQRPTLPLRDRDSSDSIILTWQVSFEEIHARRKSAADLLALMSFCDRQAIPALLLYTAKNTQERNGAIVEPDDEEELDSFDEDIQMLEDYSFISDTSKPPEKIMERLNSSPALASAHAGEYATWEMHRLVQDSMQWWLDDRRELQQAQRRYIKQLHAVMPAQSFEKWPILQILMPHVKAMSRCILFDKETALLRSEISFHAARYLQKAGVLSDANTYMTQSLSLRKAHLDSNALPVLHCGIVLAELTYEDCRYEEAEIMAVDVLKSLGAILPEDDLSLCWAKHVLAKIYCRHRQWRKATEIENEVLKVRENVKGATHPDTLSSMENLAEAYWHQGNVRKTKHLDVEVLAAREKVLGARHPDTLASMHNLSMSLRACGSYEEALKLSRECLELRSKVLGHKHPGTLRTQHHLARLHHRQGRLEAAKELSSECLRFRLAVLGETHSSTLETMELLQEVELTLQRKAEFG